MQLLHAFTTRLATKISSPKTRFLKLPPAINAMPKHTRPFDVFINYRGIDTKRTIAKLLHREFSMQGLHAFFDKENLKPGNKLLDTIDSAIQSCKVGIVIFSPRYCESYFCLHELVRLLESKKRVIPIFCDVKPSELKIINHENYSERELKRFMYALDEAKSIAGIAFKTSDSDWLEFLTTTTDAVLKNLAELDGSD